MKRVLAWSGAAVAALLVLVVVYGVFVEPRLILDQRRYEVALPGVEEGWDGAEVAVLSDLQVGMWLANTGMIRRVVDRVVDADPAVVLLAGDFVYSEDPPVAVTVDAVMQLLAPLAESGIPTYAVLGNHDYRAEAADELTSALERAGIGVLRNEAVEIPSPGGDGAGLHVVGLGAYRPGLTRPAEALDGVPADAPRIVFMHNPASFPMLPRGSAPLSVAGHTHCGQIRIPGAPLWSYLQLRAEERVTADGFAAEGYGAAGNDLFVTCGIGFSLIPMRVNAAPQVVFFELAAPA